MAQPNVYFFVDGGSLFADIVTLRQKDPRLVGAKLDVMQFVQLSAGHEHVWRFTEYKFRRFSFYVADGDERLEFEMSVPSPCTPNVRTDWRIDRVGSRLDREVARAEKWLLNEGAPQYVTDVCRRREKGVDTQICCDALTLAATGKLDRLYLYTNDADFIPLCVSLRQLGCNVNLFRLSQGLSFNEKLADQCDGLTALDVGQASRRVTDFFLLKNPPSHCAPGKWGPGTTARYPTSDP